MKRVKMNPLHYAGTKKNCARVLDSWNVYTLKLGSSDPNIWVFYIGVTEGKVEDRIRIHLTGGRNGAWGCPFVRERGVECIVDHFTFNYKKKRGKTSYQEIEVVETEVAKRLCERLKQVQEVNPNIKFLIVGPKEFGAYLTDEQILERAKNQKA